MIFFGFTFIRVSELAAKESELIAAKDQIKTLTQLNKEQLHQISELRRKNDEARVADLIKVDIADPTPTTKEGRKTYIARVAGFYADILEPKCLQMISTFHRLLEEETNDRDTDNILKIGIYVCREWMKWGKQAVSEQISYQAEEPPTPAETEEEIITQVKL